MSPTANLFTMAENQSSSSSSKTDTPVTDPLVFLKRETVELFVRGDCLHRETLLLKQHGSIDEFNKEFDLVTETLSLAEHDLVTVYMAGLKDEIASRVRFLPFERFNLWQTKLFASYYENFIEGRPWIKDRIAAAKEARRLAKELQEKALQEEEAACCGSSGDKQEDRRATQKPQSPPSASSSVLEFPPSLPLNLDQELEELQNMVKLMRKNSAPKEKLNLPDDSAELSSSDDSIERELMEKNEPEEAIADPVASKPARITSDESHNQGSNQSQSSTGQS